jgi:hypothetical protein
VGLPGTLMKRKKAFLGSSMNILSTKHTIKQKKCSWPIAVAHDLMQAYKNYSNLQSWTEKIL